MDEKFSDHYLLMNDKITYHSVWLNSVPPIKSVHPKGKMSKISCAPPPSDSLNAPTQNFSS